MKTVNRQETVHVEWPYLHENGKMQENVNVERIYVYENGKKDRNMHVGRFNCRNMARTNKRIPNIVNEERILSERTSIRR